MKVSLLSYKYPELDGPKTGVFSKIPQHGKNWNERNFETNYMANYLKKFDNYKPKLTDEISKNGIFAGNESGFKKIEKIRITTSLTAEKYKSNVFYLDFKEPKENTSVQRCWQYKQDPAIVAIDSSSSLKFVANNLCGDNFKSILLEKKENLELKDRIPETYFNDKKNFLVFEEMKDKVSKNLNYKLTDINKTTIKPFNLRAYKLDSK